MLVVLKEFMSMFTIYFTNNTNAEYLRSKIEIENIFQNIKVQKKNLSF